jgi:hypothetical protein
MPSQIGVCIIDQKKKEKRESHPSKKSQSRNILRALGLAALADVAANIIVASTNLASDSGIIFWTTNSLEIRGLGRLAGVRLDVAALGERDLAVVAGALATDLYFGTGELLLDGLVDAGLEGCESTLVSGRVVA